MISLPLADVFVPDGDEARRQAAEELAKQEYQAAKPTWFDEFVTGIVQWFGNLFTQKGAGGVAPFALTLIIVVVIAALVVALLVWGRPRATRAVARRGELLGERDDRTAAQLRAEAERLAREADWDDAVVLRYRALARSLVERDLIDPAPGATAQGIARDASTVFPAFTERLHDAATMFDAVRYLRTPADEASYRALASAEQDLRTAAPVLTTAEKVPA